MIEYRKKNAFSGGHSSIVRDWARDNCEGWFRCFWTPDPNVNQDDGHSIGHWTFHFSDEIDVIMFMFAVHVGYLSHTTLRNELYKYDQS